MSAQVETDFIASIRTTQELQDAMAIGIHERHFSARLPEWRFLQNYYQTTRELAPRELLVQAHPDFQPSVAIGHWKHHWPQLRAEYVRSQITKVVTQEGKKLQEADADPLAIARAMAAGLMDVSGIQESNRYYLDAEAEERVRAYLEKDWNEEVKSIPTGLEPLDILGRGYRPGQLIGVIARPGVGKTQIITNTSAAAWMAGFRVAFFTIEMTKEEIVQRADPILATMLGLRVPTNSELQTGGASEQRLQQYQRYANRISSRRDWLLVDGSESGIDVQEVTSIVRQHAADLVVIDGAKLLRMAGKTEWDRYKEIIRACKQLAMTERVPVLIVEHAYGNNKRDGRASTEYDPPTLDDVWMGKELGQDADIVVSLSTPRGAPLERHMKVIKNRGSITIDIRKRISCDIDMGDVGRWVDEEHVKLSSELGPWVRQAAVDKLAPTPASNQGLVFE